MSGAITALIIIVILIVIALAVSGLAKRRRSLQERFGPEYDRVVAEQDSRIKAESELAMRQRRVRSLDIQPLSEGARARYADQWVAIQEEFVDSPQTAVGRGYDLVTAVMHERGYPVDDDSQVMADLSVEHAQTVQLFRAAQDASAKAAAGKAGTEELRQAFICYRALFGELLGETKATGMPDTEGGDSVWNGQAAGVPANDRSNG